MRNNLIPDPFVQLNERETIWVGDKDWLYRKEFEADEEIIESERIELVADCLDAVCEIYLNGELVSKTLTFNAHVGYRFDIKPYIIKGINELEIVFRSPVKYAQAEKDRIGQSTIVKSFDKRIFIRKAQCHFDWDWGPEIPYSGITKDIYIEYGSSIRIKDLCVLQEHGDNYVNLDVSFVLSGNTRSDETKYYTLKITEPGGNVIIKSGVINANVKRTVLIENPVLWWTHELNPVPEQPLYKIEVLVGENGAIANASTYVGLRTIELDRSKDIYGTNFRFILNGVPIFAKGANWIPADSLIDRVGKKEYTYYVDSAIRANMNMLRVWGGGFYESDEFYDECDRRGILVWQDFCFACRPYPFFDERFYSEVKLEVEYNAKRLRLHPSLAIWCGNNEIEQMSNTWFWHTGFLKSNKKFFWEDLEAELRIYDTQTPYIPGSPVGIEFNKGVSSDNHGDNHLWVVWHGLQDVKYYRKRLTRFCSEFGFESLPDIKTIEKYADKKDYSITSKVFLAHQKCMLGNQKMEYYITSRFRLPKRFEDYVYLSQACQMECIKDATEFWRRSRERSNGSLYWQLNDCWPVCSWSSIDYYGNYKALQYHAKHFFAPVAVSIDGDKKGVRVTLLNDTLEEKKVELKLKVVDFDRGVIDEAVSGHVLASLSVTKVYDIPLREIKSKYNLRKTAIVCELSSNGICINEKTLLFKYEKFLMLNKPDLNFTSRVENGLIYLTVKAKKFTRLVRISDCVSTAPFSDNWFDLIPGEERVVTLPYYDGFKEENIELLSCYDIEPKGSRLYDFLVKAKFILNPVNLTIYLAQPRANFDYKEKHYDR